MSEKFFFLTFYFVVSVLWYCLIPIRSVMVVGIPLIQNTLFSCVQILNLIIITINITNSISIFTINLMFIIKFVGN